MPGAQPTRLLRLSGAGLCGVRWRPTRFAEDTVQRYACSLCGVIPNSTHLLPCGHALCEMCKGGSGQDGAGRVCSLDQERFGEEECIRIPFPTRKLDSLKALCWNEGHGCPFSGALRDVLHYYEEDCSYHTVECPRCGISVKYIELAAHHSTSCHGTASTAAVHHETPPNGDVFQFRDVNAALEELKALLREPHQDHLPALQSKLNELSEQMTNIGSRLRGIEAALPEIPSDEDDSVTGNHTPWHLEQRHILRRLNLLATESLARAKRADVPDSVRAISPAVSCLYYAGPYGVGVPVAASLCRPTETPERDIEAKYLFSVSKMKEIHEAFLHTRSVVGEITQWHSRHVYFTMAVIIDYENDRLEISFRLDDTGANACPQPSTLDVGILCDNGEFNEMQAADQAHAGHNGLESQHIFRYPLSEIIERQLWEDESIVVSVVLRV